MFRRKKQTGANKKAAGNSLKDPKVLKGGSDMLKKVRMFLEKYYKSFGVCVW